MGNKSQNYSVSLAPIHEERIDLIQQRVRDLAKKTLNRSQAIQIALLAFEPSSRLKALIEANNAVDQRRRVGRRKTA